MKELHCLFAYKIQTHSNNIFVITLPFDIRVVTTTLSLKLSTYLFSDDL